MANDNKNMHKGTFMNSSKSKALLSKYLPIALNFLIFIFSAVGFFLSCYFARRDGYYHWLTRLLYFTQLSNLWIGITSLVFAIILLKKTVTQKTYNIFSLLKYIFTVSITITGVIFCSFLAPFADFNVWSFASVLTHVVVPVLSIVDFFTNKSIVKIDKKFVWYTIIPPIIYFIFTSVLCVLKVDFGRGDPYPYFFMNYYSEVGLFGFIAKWPPQIGSFYWFIFFFAFIYGLSILYYKIHSLILNRKKQ